MVLSTHLHLADKISGYYYSCQCQSKDSFSSQKVSAATNFHFYLLMKNLIAKTISLKEKFVLPIERFEVLPTKRLMLHPINFFLVLH